MHGKVTGVTREKVELHSRAIVLIPLLTIETKGNPMIKQDALELAQQTVIELIKAGVIPKVGMDDAEDLAKFITDAHSKLSAYYKTLA